MNESENTEEKRFDGDGDELDHAVRAINACDPMTAIAWALVDIAVSMRESNEFRIERAEQSDKFTNMLPQLMGGLGGLFSAPGTAARATLCETCGHNLLEHDAEHCSGTVSDTIEGVPIQGFCSCTAFKFSTKK
jgi:hypothetical protein